MNCYMLRSFCFRDPQGNVYPYSMYDRRIANLRDHDYDLRAVWDLPEAGQLQRPIWQFDCPQCWTPCEAHPALLGRALRTIGSLWVR
jgi:hypothetical protein